jgi:hypothetical protein
MTQEATGPAPPGNRPSKDQAAAKPLDNASLPLAAHDDVTALCAAYAVLVEAPGEKYVRRVFLSLYSATQAVRRAQMRGRSARMVLCQLIPVDGAWTE